MTRAQMIMARFDMAEYRLCRGFNRVSHPAALRKLFQAASWIGDGWVWYALIFGLPLFYGRTAMRTSLVMAVAGLSGLVIYKVLKERLHRERPFIRHPGITLAMPPLDRYSFPSGHTLHAVSFTWLASERFPELAWVLVPVASLIAASRVVLGLHYPSDVIAGASIGAGLALTAQNFL